MKSWDSSSPMTFKRLKDRPCTEEDYSTNFFPLHSRFEGYSELTKNEMKCIEDPYEIYGDYNSDKTANL